MAETDINQVVAANLSYWMNLADPPWTQAALAEKAGVSQKTVSNYLNPEQRSPGAKGKPGSAKVHELDQIAQALGIELWQLTRRMTPQQRAVYDALEKAYRDLLATVPPTPPSPSQQSEARRKPPKYKGSA